MQKWQSLWSLSSQEFPEIYVVRVASRLKKGLDPQITPLPTPRSLMFITSSESSNVGGIPKTLQESSGGTFPLMTHRDGPSLSFLVWAFKPFGPQPRIKFIPHTIYIYIYIYIWKKKGKGLPEIKMDNNIYTQTRKILNA